MVYDQFISKISEPVNYKLSNIIVTSGIFISSVSLILFLGIIALTFYKMTVSKEMKPYFFSIILLQISHTLLILFFLINSLIYYYSNKTLFFKYNNYSFVFFIILWIVGINQVMKTLIIIPKKRSLFLTMSYYFFMGEAILFLIFNAFEKNNPFRIFVSILGLLTILYFLGWIIYEKRKNKSRLVKTRLLLLEYATIINLVWVISATFRGFFILSNNYDLAFISLFPMVILSAINPMLYYWFLFIPEWLRKKSGFDKERFEKIKKLESF